MKTREIQDRLRILGKSLEEGNDSELLVWVLRGKLACVQRPLRRHPQYGGAQKDLPAAAAPLVLKWIERISNEGFRSVICLMGDRELRHYRFPDLGVEDLLDLYRHAGLEVERIPWEDPAHADVRPGLPYGQQLRNAQQLAVAAYDRLRKPVLLHCSSGIQRSAAVAAYTSAERGGQGVL